MSVTAILIEPRGVTRVFFDGHDLAVGDQQRIAQAIECSLDQADREGAPNDQRRLSAGPQIRTNELWR